MPQILERHPDAHFVLVGGALVREGETLAAGIVLERILPRSLLLRVEGRLVEVSL